jgi:Fe-S cluster biogenesis protein NfuA
MCGKDLPVPDTADDVLPAYDLAMSSATTANTGRGPVQERVAKIISLIRPAVQSDGGDLELVDVTPEGVVKIRLHGACVGCPSSSVTLQMGVERNLKAHVPEVKSVEAVA